MNPLELRGPEFLLLYGCGLVVAALVAWLIRRAFAGPGDEPGPEHLALEPAEVALLASGAERALDTVIAQLVVRGALVPDPIARTIATKGDIPRDASRRERTVLEWIGPSPEGKKVAEVRGLARCGLVSRAKLEELGLLANDREALPARLASAAAPAAVGAGGVLKLLVGISAGRPVLFLGMLLLVTAHITIAFLLSPLRTRLGSRTLDLLRERHLGLASARCWTGRAGAADIGLAFALLGPKVLTSATYGDLKTILETPPSQSSGAGGCGSGGCGSGGCGGGCGGCGGCGG